MVEGKTVIWVLFEIGNAGSEAELLSDASEDTLETQKGHMGISWGGGRKAFSHLSETRTLQRQTLPVKAGHIKLKDEIRIVLTCWTLEHASAEAVQKLDNLKLNSLTH